MKYDVYAKSFNPQTGEEIPSKRTEPERIDTNDNILFAHCRSILDVKEAYENFWNRMATKPSALVFVTKIVPIKEKR